MRVKQLKNSSDWGMPSRTGIGVTISVLYAGLLIALIIWRWEDVAKLGLNELGDFAAGAFGPMAILWLVLGYFQQGDELKQNTDALIQQATELKQSAEHQAALVEVSRMQVNAEVERHREERRRQKLKMQPRFSLSWEAEGYTGRGKLTITNIGSECSDLYVHCDEETEGGNIFLNVFGDYPILRRNEEIIASLLIPGIERVESLHISIRYNDGDDIEYVQTYEGVCQSGGRIPTIDYESYAEMAERTEFQAELLADFVTPAAATQEHP